MAVNNEGRSANDGDSCHAGDTEDIDRCENKSDEASIASSTTVVEDDDVHTHLASLQIARLKSIVVAWVCIVIISSFAWLVGMALVAAVVGRGPITIRGGSPAAAIALILAIRCGLAAKLSLLFARREQLPSVARCPTCDAAFVPDTQYECSCCETKQRSNRLRHWSSPCPSCEIEPDAVMCWRCKCVVRTNRSKSLRAISILNRPPQTQRR
jgi:hypothetical protein